jgi:hypothetical protein
MKTWPSGDVSTRLALGGGAETAHELEFEIEQIRARLAANEAERKELEAALNDLVSRSSAAAANYSSSAIADAPEVMAASSAAEKITLFRRLFAGRTDVFPARWENRKTAKSGYAPACANEWVKGICGKPQVKCGECPHQAFISVTDAIIEKHLRGGDGARGSGGDFVAGVYPLLPDETCWFLAADFDEESWAADALAVLETCQAKGVPAALERSRSGNGGHVWIFFSEPVSARTARQLGAAMLTETMERRPEIGFASYDRFFPSQDTMPVGGFGNLIALPLQRRARELGNSVFIDEDLRPYDDQWAFLATRPRLSAKAAADIVDDAEKRGRILGIRMPVEDEDADEPWRMTPSRRPKAVPVGSRQSPIGQDHDSGRRPTLYRPDRFAAGDDCAAHTLGGFPKSRVLPCAVHAFSDLRQASDYLLRRTSSASCGAAPRMPRRSCRADPRRGC